MVDKHYVYGCSHLLRNLRDLIYVAARYEEEGKSIEDWLRHQGYKNIHLSSRRKLTWGSAINLVIIRQTKQLLRIREDSMEDWPF
mgnify:FL=1|tara:strand:- start:77 stop:331 length:255 start_codon:yes stop_codon:yes gene_type:complete